MSINVAQSTEKRRRFLLPFNPTAGSSSDFFNSHSPTPVPASDTGKPETASAPQAPSSHPFSAGFQAKLKLASLSRTADDQATGESGSEGAQGKDKGPKRPARGHYRTPSALAAALGRGKDKEVEEGEVGGLKGAQVVRTPSDAWKGVNTARTGTLDSNPSAQVIGLQAVPPPLSCAGTRAASATTHGSSLSRAVKRLSGHSSSPPAADSKSSRTETPPSSLVGSADLPMMEECDWRISMPPPAPPVPIIAPTVVPVRPSRGLAKVPSLPTIPQSIGRQHPPTQQVRLSVHGSVILPGTKPLRIAPRPKQPFAGDIALPPAPQPHHPGSSLIRKPSLLRKPSLIRKPSLKPVTSIKPASAASNDFTSNVKTIDLSQRPAPTPEDDVLVRIEFAFSSMSTTAGLEGKKECILTTLPIDVLRRAPGKLLDYVEAQLEPLMVGSKAIARNSDGSATTIESTSTRPGMTDGESAASSDAETDDQVDDVDTVDAYGAEDILRNEYLKSLWIPSPTQLKSTNPPIPSPPTPVSHVSYPTAPKGRARTRNQYAQHTAHTPFPAPSSPIVPPSVSLSMRRRATYIALPPASMRGLMTEVRVLMLRDGAVWGEIMGRIILGKWPTLTAISGEKGAELRRKVKEELEWADMGYLVPEVSLEVERHQEGGGTVNEALPSMTPPTEDDPVCAQEEANTHEEEVAIAVTSDDEGFSPALLSSKLNSRAPVSPPRRMSLFHKPTQTQTPPVIPVVSITPPVSGFSAGSTTDEASGTGTASGFSVGTPAHLSAYPFPDQAQAMGARTERTEREGRSLTGKAKLGLSAFPAPPPRPARSIYRTASSEKIGEAGRTGPHPRSQPAGKVSDKRTSVHAGVVRSTGGSGSGVRAGGRGYI